MRSAVYDAFGRPEQVLRVEEREKPVPGAGQVLVRMGLSAIHNHDLMTIAGKYGYKHTLPAAPGAVSDWAGPAAAPRRAPIAWGGRFWARCVRRG